MSGYLPPGCTQQECDEAQPGYWDPPLVEVACDMCGGEGGIEHWESVSKWSIDPPSAIVIPCENCDGRGFFICEAEGDRPRTKDTPSIMGRDGT